MGNLSPLQVEAVRTERERVRALLARLREGRDAPGDFRSYRELLAKRRVVTDAQMRQLLGPDRNGSDVATWAREVSYFQGYIDGLALAMEIPDKAEEDPTHGR